MNFGSEDPRRLERAAWSSMTLAALRATLCALALYAFAFALAAVLLPSIRRWLPLVEGLSISGSLVLAHLYRRSLQSERRH